MTLSYAKLCSDRPDDEFTRKIDDKLRYVATQCEDNGLLELHRNLPSDADRALQGLVFLCMLKRGHNSSLWAKLTWTERVNLYVIQVNLTPLPNSRPFSTWKSESDISDEIKTSQALCSRTQNHLRYLWGNTISPNNWRSDAPLRGITEVLKLPGLKKELESYLSLPQSCICKQEKCHDALLNKVDHLIKALFSEVPNLHERLSDQSAQLESV
ncbi:hypothetical protein FRC08_015868 [Ceratobasidium sp. 394]|nr:hypothetical protein FRC08_015868 [Ceratobasidium sp. 394]